MSLYIPPRAGFTVAIGPLTKKSPTRNSARDIRISWGKLRRSRAVLPGEASKFLSGCIATRFTMVDIRLYGYNMALRLYRVYYSGDSTLTPQISNLAWRDIPFFSTTGDGRYRNAEHYYFSIKSIEPPPSYKHLKRRSDSNADRVSSSPRSANRSRPFLTMTCSLVCSPSQSSRPTIHRRARFHSALATLYVGPQKGRLREKSRCIWSGNC